MTELQENVLEKCNADKGCVVRKVELANEDPRHIAPTIASVMPEETNEIVA